MPHSHLRDWSPRDLKLAIAQVIVTDSIGPCGLSHMDTTGDREGDFIVDDTQCCWACYEAEKYRRENDDIPPGTLLRVRERTDDDE